MREGANWDSVNNRLTLEKRWPRGRGAGRVLGSGRGPRFSSLSTWVRLSGWDFGWPMPRVKQEGYVALERVSCLGLGNAV